MLEIVWFWLVTALLAGYVIFDGFDLGAGIAHLLIARTPEDRARVLAAIGPHWHGNEVWLVALGGTLFLAFPALYASSFAGFYLPLTIVLWLLMLRGAAIEFRSHVESAAWQPFWDVTFAGASAMLALFLGIALGNVVRGVPLDHRGEFFLPLWTHWGVGGRVGILDWFTTLAGVTAFCALATHGALWLYLKTTGPLQARAKRLALLAASATLLLTVALSLATFRVQPQVTASFAARPWGVVFPAFAALGMAGVFYGLSVGREAWAFVSSCVFLLGLMATAAFGVFPLVLPSNTDPAMSLTIYNAAAGHYGLGVGLAWWIPGMALVLAYFFFAYRRFAGKIE